MTLIGLVGCKDVVADLWSPLFFDLGIVGDLGLVGSLANRTCLGREGEAPLGLFRSTVCSAGLWVSLVDGFLEFRSP